MADQQSYLLCKACRTKYMYMYILCLFVENESVHDKHLNKKICFPVTEVS